MTATELRDVVDFELRLNVGDEVEVRWTNSHRFYAGRARIVKLNKSSIVTKLTEPVLSQLGYSDYPIGHKITVPSLNAIKLWSVNNRVAPLDTSVA